MAAAAFFTQAREGRAQAAPPPFRNGDSVSCPQGGEWIRHHGRWIIPGQLQGLNLHDWVVTSWWQTRHTPGTKFALVHRLTAQETGLITGDHYTSCVLTGDTFSQEPVSGPWLRWIAWQAAHTRTVSVHLELPSGIVTLHSRTVGGDVFFPPLLRLPAEPFEKAMTFQPRVDRYSRITVKMCSYSVPVRFIDRNVTVHLTSDTLVVFDNRREIARHARLAGLGSGAPDPGPLPGGAAAQARRASRLRGTAPGPRRGHLARRTRAFWAMANQQLGESEGAKALVRILLLHRHQQHADVIAGLRAAVELRSCSEDVVALDARKAAQAAGRTPTVTADPAPSGPFEPPGPQLPQVSHLTAHRLAGPLPEDARPLPRLEQWDELLHLRRKDSS
ncbi:Mu transposase domain-containing protein [Streptomyces lydicus]|uniref:Mu transposase domain-containing protein n=1 Tax=Streptomyces lydicus TaxID=47763 RepID=UPI0037BAAE23